MFRLLILLIALGSGGIAAWLALSATEAPPPAEVATLAVPETVFTHEVLVANGTIGHGMVLDSAQLRWEPWAGDSVPPVFISKSASPDAPDKLAGSLVRSGFVAGEPIRQDRLSQPGAGFLSGMLPPGKRAIAVRVTAESTAGGFILPNDRVDVIHTFSNRSGGEGQVTSRAILTNVRVLAVDQTAAEASADGTAVVGKTATLEVDPEQMSIIAAAEASGTISLALRAAADEGEATLVSEKKNQKGVVRIVGGGRARLVDVPTSELSGS